VCRVARFKESVMGARRIRREQRRDDMAQSRRTNGMLKMKERIRRHKRLVDFLKNGKLPYTPTVMSWLSAELNKPARQIVQADVDQLLQQD
ncbi:MAG: hypothetical protein ACRELF_15850, partial [Gemmataceae bacterium]